MQCFGAFCSRLLKCCTDTCEFICQESLQEINTKFLASHRAEAREAVCICLCRAGTTTGALTLDSGDLNPQFHLSIPIVSYTNYLFCPCLCSLICKM